jgi:hypothetical protein
MVRGQGWKISGEIPLIKRIEPFAVISGRMPRQGTALDGSSG